MWDRLKRWFARDRPGRTELIERKHRLEGEIAMLSARARQIRSRGEDPSDVERRLAQAREAQYQTRLEIDRAEPGT